MIPDAPPVRYYPVLLDLRGRLAVIVGGSQAAERKARSLARDGADVVVIARDVSESLTQMEADGTLTIEPRGYVRGDLEGALVVLCFEESDEVRRAVFTEADERGTLVNVDGSSELCTFLIPSVVRRGDLQIAVSTGGVSPETARRVRASIAEEYGPEWEPYVRLLGDVRPLLAKRMPGDPEGRTAVFGAIAASDLLERLKAGAEPTAAEIVDEFGPAVEAEHEDGNEERR